MQPLLGQRIGDLLDLGAVLPRIGYEYVVMPHLIPDTPRRACRSPDLRRAIFAAAALSPRCPFG